MAPLAFATKGSLPSVHWELIFFQRLNAWDNMERVIWGGALTVQQKLYQCLVFACCSFVQGCAGL